MGFFNQKKSKNNSNIEYKDENNIISHNYNNNTYSPLYSQIRYISPYDFLISKKIEEYDLEKANISIFYEYGVLKESEYNYFYKLPKKEREVKIGLLLRKNKDLVNLLKQGIIESKKMFFENNNIKTENILYIDNDSITIVYDNNLLRLNNIENEIKYTKFSKKINFKKKSEYTSFYKLNNGIDFLYYNKNNIENYRLKNCGQNFIESKHKNYFLDLLLSIAYQAQNCTIEDSIKFVVNIYYQYINKLLPIQYYREFNHFSQYKIFTDSNIFTFYTDIDNYNNINNVNIFCNEDIIRSFYKYFMKIYFLQK